MLNKKNRSKNDNSRSYESQKKVVELGTKQMIKNQIMTNSYFNLFCSTIKFIGLRAWLIQIVIISLCLFQLYANKSANFENLLKGLTILISLSVIFFIDELFKSFTSNMWELEQTFKYDLRQHITMKLLIFGVFDFVLILTLSVIGRQFVPVTFLHFALFLLAPFNIICIVLLSIFTLLRKLLSNVILWCCSGAIMSLSIIVSNLVNIYELPINYWITTYMMTSIVLCILVKQMLKNRNRGGLFL